ncbi:MAG: AraC family transcriptional regulator, partial [Eubacterium sp.]|nr:AraC family transcriptional regulator [Eubacterium sp.]
LYAIIILVINLSRESKFRLVQEIQDYINKNIDREDFSADDVCVHFSYSIRHINRLFCEILGKTANEYINSIKLSKSAQDIDSYNTILEATLDCGYASQQGYAKAFYKMFGCQPARYKTKKPMIPLYISYPVWHYYEHYYGKGEKELNSETIVCSAYAVSRPKRKMIILYAEEATDYFTFCEEKSCDWEGYLNSNPHKLDTAAILNLPSALVKKGCSDIAAGIEIPFDCEVGELLNGYEIIGLEPCKLMYFKS